MVQPKAIKKYKRILLAVTCVWLAVVAAYYALPIYAADSASEGFVDTAFLISYVAVSLGIVLLPLLTISTQNRKAVIALKISGAIAIAGVAFALLFLVAYISMCTWTTECVLFRNKQNPAVVILDRSYDCGDTDDEPDSTDAHQVMKARYLTTHFMWVTKTDTNHIDENTWLRVDNSDL